MRKFHSLFGNSSDLAIDLGTENTLIRSTGRVTREWDEPSLVAYACPPDGVRYPLVAGHRALQMEGRTTDAVQIVRPLVNGVIVHLTAAIHMLKTLLEQGSHDASMSIRQVLISFPHAITSIEKMAFYDLVRNLHPSRILLVEEPLAAAVGSGLDILGNQGHMLVDLGKGIVEAVVISQGRIVASSSLRLEGKTENERLQQYLRECHSLVVGDASVEQLKRQLHPGLQQETQAIKGLSLTSGLPQRFSISSQELLEILNPYLEEISQCILETLEQTPVELLGDIMDRGIMMTGGGTLSPSLISRLEKILKLSLHRVPVPLAAVSLGNKRILGDADLQIALCS